MYNPIVGANFTIISYVSLIFLDKLKFYNNFCSLNLQK